MSTVTLEPFQTVVLQRMEVLVPLLVERIQTSNFLSPEGTLLLSNLTSAKSPETPPGTSSPSEESLSMAIEDGSCEIIDASTTSSRKFGGSNASYLVIRPKASRETRTESEQTSSPSSIPSSDLVSKTLVLHSVSITPELANVLKNSDLEEIRMKYCPSKLGFLDLTLFKELERLYISLDPYGSHNIKLPRGLKMLVVHVNEHDSTKSDNAGFCTHIDAGECNVLEHM